MEPKCSKWLRDVKKVDTTKLSRYRHVYPDGRVVEANLYPLSLLKDFRLHFFNVWLPQKANTYFQEKDPKALPHLSKLVPLPAEGTTLLDDATAKAGFEKIKGKIAAATDHFKK